MKLTITETLENTKAYYSEEFKELVLEELYHKAYRTLRSVFMFENFEQYEYQLKSDKQGVSPTSPTKPTLRNFVEYGQVSFQTYSSIR